MDKLVRKGPEWISGPDPLHHRMYIQYGYHRQTARQRGEAWELTWPQWRDAWLPRWDQRGRSAYSLCMARKDLELGWSMDNIEFVTRREHSRRIRKHYQ